MAIKVPGTIANGRRQVTPVKSGQKSIPGGKVPTLPSLSALEAKAKAGSKPVSKPAAKAPVKAPAKPAALPAATAWKSDPVYQATLASMQHELGTFGNNQATLGSRYDTQYDTDLSRLGLQNAQGQEQHVNVNPLNPYGWDQSVATTDPKTGAQALHGSMTAPQAAASATPYWDQIHADTSSGKAYTDLNNDFAARGMLQSSAFNTANQNVGAGFAQQLGDAQNSRGQFLHDLTQQNQDEQYKVNDQLTQAKLAAIQNQSNQQATNAVRAAAGIGATK